MLSISGLVSEPLLYEPETAGIQSSLRHIMSYSDIYGPLVFSDFFVILNATTFGTSVLK